MHTTTNRVRPAFTKANGLPDTPADLDDIADPDEDPDAAGSQVHAIAFELTEDDCGLFDASQAEAQAAVVAHARAWFPTSPAEAWGKMRRHLPATDATPPARLDWIRKRLEAIEAGAIPFDPKVPRRPHQSKREPGGRGRPAMSTDNRRVRAILEASEDVSDAVDDLLAAATSACTSGNARRGSLSRKRLLRILCSLDTITSDGVADVLRARVGYTPATKTVTEYRAAASFASTMIARFCQAAN